MNPVSTHGYANVIGGKVEFFDSSTGLTHICNDVVYSQIGFDTAEFDFSPSTLCALGCADFCGLVYEQGDEIWITGQYVINDFDICRSALFNNVIVDTELYGAVTANPPPNTIAPCGTCDPIIYPDNRFTCDRYIDSYSLITPFTTIAGTQSVDAVGCDPVRVNTSYYWGIGPSSSYFYNLFQKEYRPFGIWDTVYFAVPDGYTPVKWDLDNRIGNGSVTTSTVESLTDIPFDFIDNSNFAGAQGSTIYGFNIKQYYDSNQLTISDDGGLFTLSATLEPECSLENFAKDTLEYWGTPFWFISEMECDTFGPRSPDYLTYYQSQLSLQSDQPTSFGDCPEIEWPLRIIGENNEDASNVFIYIPPGTIQINDILDDTSTPLVHANNIWEVGDILGPSNNNFTIQADYLTCDYDSILVMVGYDCSGIPANIEDYNCGLETIVLYLEPRQPDFNLAILQPTVAQEYNLCDEIPFEFQYRNVGESKAYDLIARVFLPQNNASIVPGSMEIEYPCGTGYEPWVSTYPNAVPVPLGTLWRIRVTNESSANANIDLIGEIPDDGWVYPGISEVDNCFNIKFNVSTECGFKSSEQAVRTLLVGKSSCGINGDPNGRIVAEIENATSIEIAGTDPYATNITTTFADTLTACTGNETMNVQVEMLGPGTTGTLDSIELRLPSGIDYVSNTSGQTPTIINNLSGLTSVLLSIDPPLNVGETFNFDIEYSIDKDSLDCANNVISINSFMVEDIQCSTAPPGELCEVYSATGYNETNFYLDKPNLGLVINTASASCSSADLLLDYEVEIFNNSAKDISATESFTIDLIANFDGSCTVFGDTAFVQKLIVNGPIAAGASQILTGTITDFPIDACHIIAQANDCACDNNAVGCTEVIITDLPANTYAECYPNNITVETCENADFTYSWNAIAPASNTWFTGATDIYNPNLDLPDPGTTTQDYQFEVNLDRGIGCRTKDTVTITVYPLIDEQNPIVNSVCIGFDTQLNGPDGFTGTWTPSTNLVDPTDPKTIVTNPTNTSAIAYTFSYTDPNGCAAQYTESVLAEACIDLELDKTLVTPAPIYNGDIIQFQLSLTNTSANDATNIVVRDSLPGCVTYDFNHTTNPSETLNYSLDVLDWVIPTLAANATTTVTFDVMVTDISDCVNQAQVYSTDQTDIDSTPDNDDGDQSEDDEASISFFSCKPTICLPIEIIRK